MSWHEMKVIDNSAGRLIEIFDNILLLNSYWSKVDDTANGMGANEAVYRCYDPYGVTDYYMRVKNNQAAYADIEMWEDWNSVTHAGIGSYIVSASSASYYMRINYDRFVKIQLRNFRFAFLDAINQGHFFIGRPDELFDETKNIVLAIVRTTNTTAGNNPFGAGTGNSSTYCARFLFDENGAQSYLDLSTITCPETIAGTMILDKTRVRNVTTYKAVGYIHDNVSCGAASILGVFRGQIRYDQDGYAWEAVGYSASSYNSYIKQA